MTDYSRSVGVTKYDFSTHINKFINKEQTTFKHFLMNKDTSSCLGGNHQNDTQQIGGKSWPWGIRYGHNRAVDKALDFVAIGVRRDINIILLSFNLYAQLSKHIWNLAQIVP